MGAAAPTWLAFRPGLTFTTTLLYISYANADILVITIVYNHIPIYEKYMAQSEWWRVHNELTHWGRVTHICVGNLTIIGSDNDLWHGRRQAIIWTNPGLLLIGPLGTNFNEILIEMHTISRKCIWKCRLRNGGHLVSAVMC